MGDDARERSASIAALRTDFASRNSPLRGESRDDWPLNESDSRPRFPTAKFKPRFGAGDSTTADVAVLSRCDSAFAGLVTAKTVEPKSSRKTLVSEECKVMIVTCN